MAKAKFLAAVSKNDVPYITLFKVVDGAPQKMSDGVISSPNALAKVEFSPDTQLLLAARADASDDPTANLVIWERFGDTFTQWDPAASPLTGSGSTTINDIKFFDDTCVFLATSRGVQIGVIDKANKKITFSVVGTVVAAAKTIAIKADKTRVFVGLSASPWMLSFVATATPGVFTGGGATSGAPTAAIDLMMFLDATRLLYTRAGATAIFMKTVASSGSLGSEVTHALGTTISNYQFAVAPETDRLRLIFSVFGGYGVGAFLTSLVPPATSTAFNFFPYVPTSAAADFTTSAQWGAVQYDTDGSVFVASSSGSRGNLRRFTTKNDGWGFVEDTRWSALSKQNAYFWDFSISAEFEDGIRKLYAGSIKYLMTNAPTTFKAALVKNKGSFNVAHTSLSAVLAAGGGEVFGGEWLQGGVTVVSSGVTRNGANAQVDIAFDSIDYSAETPLTFNAVVIYDDSHADKIPIAYVEFNSPRTIKPFDNAAFEFADGHAVVFAPKK